jgi:hypothetical protein
MPLELGNTNYQLPTGRDRDGFLATPAEPPRQPPPTEAERAAALSRAKKDDGEGASLVKYHRDAYPFVCVVMLSDTEGMIGGEVRFLLFEPIFIAFLDSLLSRVLNRAVLTDYSLAQTALKAADGSVLKVKGPSVGSAVVLQGRSIEHAALKAFTGERVTMVTSYRAKDPMVEGASSAFLHFRFETLPHPGSSSPALFPRSTTYHPRDIEEEPPQLPMECVFSPSLSLLFLLSYLVSWLL